MMNEQPRVMRTPRSVSIDLTARCNLRCRYCYFFDNPVVPYEDLPTEAWLQFFDELGRCAVMDVDLAGGEPFARQDLPELLDGIVRNHMRFALLSNGTLIDDDIAAYIANTGRCKYVQVSLDGSRPETHDACRGQGAFEAAVRGLKTLQRHNINVAVRVTIHRYNVRDLEATADFLLEELELPAFGTNAVGYLGSCRVNADEVMLTTEERQVAMAALTRVAEKYPGRIQATAGPLADAQMWRRMVEAEQAGAPAFSNGGRLTGCGCHSHKIAIRVDGAITPCTMLPHIVLGYINQDDLTEVWQHHPALNTLRTRHNLALSEFEFCEGCQYMPYCTGNCPALAYTLTGQVNHPSPDACLRRFLEEGGQVPA